MTPNIGRHVLDRKGVVFAHRRGFYHPQGTPAQGIWTIEYSVLSLETINVQSKLQARGQRNLLFPRLVQARLELAGAFRHTSVHDLGMPRPISLLEHDSTGVVTSFYLVIATGRDGSTTTDTTLRLRKGFRWTTGQPPTLWLDAQVGFGISQSVA